MPPEPRRDGTVVVRAALPPEDVVRVARGRPVIALDPAAHAAISASRELVEKALGSGEPAYGISTGFGGLATRHIPEDRREQLQRSLVRSHAAGMGPAVEDDVVRAMILLRARTLTMGYSGVRPEVVEAMVALLDAGITPVVPEHGSLGCSGDLAPLAHVALALMGEGEVLTDAGPVPAATALAGAGISPVVLREKEGLALINGTDGMLGMLLLALHDANNLLKVAEIAAAMSVEGLLGTDRAFAADLVGLRPHEGQRASAENLRTLLDGSPIVASHRLEDPRVQDAYSIRCTPQVLGAARDTVAFAARTAEHELRAAIDNPVILHDGRVESNGNFHGAPLGYACDFLAIVLADVGAMAERRIDRALDAHRSHGLPPFLADDPGVDSGLMIAQYTAAGLVAESKRLATPASVDTIPTSAMQEDHVSMGWGAARKLRSVVDNLSRILAIELTVAARAIALRAPLRPAAGTGAAFELVQEVVGGPGPDRVLAPLLSAVDALVRSGEVVEAVESAVGALR